MKRAWIVVLALTMGAALALAAEEGGQKGEKKAEGRERPRKEMTEEQKKQELEGRVKEWERQLANAQSSRGLAGLATLEKEAAEVADAALKKEVEDVVAKGKTLVAGLESAVSSGKRGEYDEAMRVSRDVQKAQGEIGAAMRTLPIKIDIDKYTQKGAKADAAADVKAACQKVVEVSKKKLDLMSQIAELQKQLGATDGEIRSAKNATIPTPERAARGEGGAREKREGAPIKVAPEGTVR